MVGQIIRDVLFFLQYLELSKKLIHFFYIFLEQSNNKQSKAKQIKTNQNGRSKKKNRKNRKNE